jgi:hypothetical protein
MPGHRRLYVWPPVVPTSSCQCSALAREIKRARRIRARSRKCLAAAANPFLGRGHLDTRLANHTLDGLLKGNDYFGIKSISDPLPRAIRVGGFERDNK